MQVERQYVITVDIRFQVALAARVLVPANYFPVFASWRIAVAVPAVIPRMNDSTL